MSTNQYQEEVTDSENNVSQNQNQNQSSISTKPYSDYLIDGVPIWEKENRMWTHEEAEAHKKEIERLGRD